MLGGHWYKYAFEFYRYAKKPLVSGFFFCLFIFRARRREHGFHAFNETAIGCRAAAPKGFAAAHGELAQKDGELHEQGQEGFDGEVATGA